MRLILFFILAVSVVGQLTPIARFDVVPLQRIDAGETFNIGVVAFSKAGIDKVEFHISGQGYTGQNPLIATEMTLNPRTYVWEYWVPLSADDFASDGPINIEATVYGNDGGVRNKNWVAEGTFGEGYDLECWTESNGNSHQYHCRVTGDFNTDLLYSKIHIYKNDWWLGLDELIDSADGSLHFHYATTYGANPTDLFYTPKEGDHFVISRGYGLDPVVLFVNPHGTLPEPIAYVDVNGDDATGVVNDGSKPYATVGSAMEGIMKWMNAQGYGNNIGGSIIKLNPGNHVQSNGGFWGFIESEEWVTVTSNDEAGGNKENTYISAGSSVDTRYIHAKDLTLTSADNSDVFAAGSANRHLFHLWVDGCDLVGATKFSENSKPVTSQHSYWTDTYFTNVGKAITDAKLARNIVAAHIGDDVAVRSPFVINIQAFDVDPRDGTCTGGGCAHADCWQWWGGPVPHNMIIYNFICINSTYQGIFARTQDGNVPIGFQNPPAEGVAIVNMQTKLIEPKDFADNSWYISANHMLMWHNTFDEEFNFWNDGDSGGYDYPLNIIDFDVKGNSFFDVELNAQVGDDNGGIARSPGIALESWAHNHYLHEQGWEYFSQTPGTDVTIGDPMVDRSGIPLEGSPLIDRLQALVPVDVHNNERILADIGALEHGGCAELTLHELAAVIDGWRMGTKNINQVMQGINLWKSGC